ncbi:MAG: hypothetical protein GY942_25675 [Aestuariibacter sp.]|nr:hypothetical protein [Aestuariibacter sp.]
MTALHILIGLFIKHIESIHDYIQIVFADGTVLNIFNTYSYDGASLFNVSDVKVIDVDELEEIVNIKLENGGVLLIDLKEAAYNGPEAMVLIRKGESPVVWN